MKTGQVVVGILAGVAIGALAGVLFAPEKGSKTRKQILNRSEDYADELKEKLDEAIENVNKKYERLREEAEMLAERGKAKYASMGKDHSPASKETSNV